MEVGVVVVQQDQKFGAEGRDLPADLGPYGPAGPGHQDSPALDGGPHGGQIGDDLPSSQEVVDAGLAGRADGHRRIGDRSDQLAQVGDDLECDLGVLGRHEAPLDQGCRRVGHGQEQLLDLQPGGHRRQFAHPEPTTGTPSRDSPWVRTSSSKTATGNNPAAGLRSISRTTAAPASRLPTTPTPESHAPVGPLPPEESAVEPEHADADHGEQTAQRQDLQRHPGHVEGESQGIEHEEHGQGGEASTRHDVARLFDAGVAPDSTV